MHNSTKKVLLLGFFGCLVVPNFVLAAWWNPLSWFNNWGFLGRTDTKTEMLENRIKELESKLEIGTATTVVEVSSTTPYVKKEVKKIDQTYKSTAIQNTSVKTSVSIPRDYGSLFSTLEESVVHFRDTLVVNDINDVKLSDIQNSNQKDFLSYLDKLGIQLDSLLTNIIKKNSTEFDNLNNEYLRLFSEYKFNKTKYLNILNTDRSDKEEALKNSVEQQASINEEYVRKINIKIAEMYQLDTQIDAYSGDILLTALNGAKKLDGSPVFGPIHQGCGYSPVTYPYTSMWDSCKRFLHNFVSLYRSELQVDLAKYQ